MTEKTIEEAPEPTHVHWRVVGMIPGTEWFGPHVDFDGEYVVITQYPGGLHNTLTIWVHRDRVASVEKFESFEASE